MIRILSPLINQLILILLKVICLLVAIAYYTIAERKIMAAIQRRRGPNVVGVGGLLQPVADGLKLVAKEMVIPTHSSSRIFVIAPLAVLALSLLSGSVIPFGLFDLFESRLVPTANLADLYVKENHGLDYLDLFQGYKYGGDRLGCTFKEKPGTVLINIGSLGGAALGVAFGSQLWDELPAEQKAALLQSAAIAIEYAKEMYENGEMPGAIYQYLRRERAAILTHYLGEENGNLLNTLFSVGRSPTEIILAGTLNQIPKALAKKTPDQIRINEFYKIFPDGCKNKPDGTRSRMNTKTGEGEPEVVKEDYLFDPVLFNVLIVLLALVALITLVYLYGDLIEIFILEILCEYCPEVIGTRIDFLIQGSKSVNFLILFLKAKMISPFW